MQAILHSLLFALILLLPGVEGALFGWMHFLVPLTVFFYLYKWENGPVLVISGFLVALVGSLILGTFWMLIFSSALIPAGYTLAHSAFRSETPAMSGFRATLFLGGCWAALLIGQTVITGLNPISGFLGGLDLSIEQTLQYYRQNDTMAPDTLALFEQSFGQMKIILPKLIFSLLLSFALAIIWLTMLAGNRFVLKFAGYRPWAHYSVWQLPDRLVWLLIGSTVLAMLPLGVIRLAGVNTLIVLCVIYFFQGFSIFSYFLHKWNVPPFLRFLLYGMMLFQSFGTALLLVIGIGDVWMDLRRLKKHLVKPDDDGDLNN
jgi:uncharacterized protein YybS (DUF2232 family)